MRVVFENNSENIPSEARLINSAAKPPAERSEANKVSFYLYMFSAEGEQLVFTYVLIG